jgi:hypothetical protein
MIIRHSRNHDLWWSVDVDMYDLYDQLMLEEFEWFQQRRDAVQGFDMTSGLTKNPGFGQHKGKSLSQPRPVVTPSNSAADSQGGPPPNVGYPDQWSEYGGQQGMYRGNPVDYSIDGPGRHMTPNPTRVGQPNGFIPNGGPPGGMPDCATSRPLSPTESAISRLGEQLDRLHATARTLRSRLDPVLSPACPENMEDSCLDPRCQHAPIVEGLSSQTASLSNAIDVLDNILGRLEL